MSETSHKVLIVDPDGVSRRFVEFSLGAMGWHVESAKDATSALDILQTTLFDAIVAESNLPDIPALQLHRRLMQSSRLKEIAFIVISSDTRVTAKVSALRAGIDDYLTKPYEPQELAARIE